MSVAKGLSNALLKGILTDALVERGYFSDIDGTVNPGIYRGNGGSPATWQGTFPSDAYDWVYGSLIVLPTRYTAMQILISESCKIALRILANGSWGRWRILTPS